MDITGINDNKIFIATCYLAPINYNFYQKKNLDLNCPYNELEHDIYSFQE